MSSPLLALKTAIRAKLALDATLGGLLNGASVFDQPPRNHALPYVVFDEATVRSDGTSVISGHETSLLLTVWSKQGGSREAGLIADRIELLLDGASLALVGHRLINLLHVQSTMRREKDGATWRMQCRYRAVTEVL
jgi:hypothetical protein